MLRRVNRKNSLYLVYAPVPLGSSRISKYFSKGSMLVLHGQAVACVVPLPLGCLRR